MRVGIIWNAQGELIKMLLLCRAQREPIEPSSWDGGTVRPGKGDCRLEPGKGYPCVHGDAIDSLRQRLGRNPENVARGT